MCVDARINGHVASDTDIDVAHVDDTAWLALEEVREIVFLFLRRQAGRVGNRGQEDGVFGVIGDDVLGVAGLQRGVPAVEQGRYMLVGCAHGKFQMYYYN